MSAGAQDALPLPAVAPVPGATGMGPIRFNERSALAAELLALQPAYQLALVGHLDQRLVNEQLVHAFGILERTLAGLGFRLHTVVIEPAEMYVSSASTAVRRGRAFVNEASTPLSPVTAPLFRIGLELTAAVNQGGEHKPFEAMSVLAWNLDEVVLVRNPFSVDAESALVFCKNLMSDLAP